MIDSHAPYSDQLHAQARDIADRVLQATQDLQQEEPAPNVGAALLLATGPIAMEIAQGADCCADDQLGLAVMLAAELALRAAPCPSHSAT